MSAWNGNTALTISTSSGLRDYVSDSSDYSSEATSPESTSSFDSDSSISSPIWSMFRDQTVLDTFPKYITKFSSELLDEISIPMSG